jgi:hypothetical protein
MKDREVVRGASIIVSNAAVQVGGLLAILDVGGETHEQAETTLRACDLATVAIHEAEPVMRQLARRPRKGA